MRGITSYMPLQEGATVRGFGKDASRCRPHPVQLTATSTGLVIQRAGLGEPSQAYLALGRGGVAKLAGLLLGALPSSVVIDALGGGAQAGTLFNQLDALVQHLEDQGH